MAETPFGPRTDGDAQRLGAEALGEPGQRRFRLLMLIDGETHIAWMEKQQLQALGLAIEQVLEQLSDVGPEVDVRATPIEFDAETRFQFRVGRMELGFDEQRDRLVIIAHDVDVETEEPPRLTCRFTRDQARDLSAEAATIVAAGRPRCVLCGAPIGPEPHVCPQQNGHFSIHVDDVEVDEEP